MEFDLDKLIAKHIYIYGYCNKNYYKKSLFIRKTNIL